MSVSKITETSRTLELMVAYLLNLGCDMVVLHVKKGDESQFLYETTVATPVDELISQLVPIFNGRLKVNRICAGNLFYTN